MNTAARSLDEDRRALELLSSAGRVLLTGHERPDGDCIGAQAALAGVLARMGKQVRILNPDAPEERYDFLTSRLEYGAFSGGPVPEHDLAVLLDCSELGRCGELAEPLARAPSKKLVIDHHLHGGEAWWDAAYRDPSCAATGLLVHRIARELSVELDALAAEGVFTSLVSDTGWFKYSNTDAESFAAAAELVARGVDPARLYGAVYQRRPAAHPRALARVLASLEYLADGRVALLRVDAGTDAEGFESEDVLDLLRAVERVELVLLLREQGARSWKLSARSKHGFDVAALAGAFGGGGHAKAAGASLSGSFEEVRASLVAAALGRLGAEAGPG